jgi:hypothetical protein
MPRSALFALSLVLGTASLLAQSAAQLVGPTRIAGDLRRYSTAACAPVANCVPAGFPSGAGLPPTAGGAGWDAMRSGAWISNGQFVACVDDACNYLCTPGVIPGMPGGVFAVGMEVVTRTQELWVLDSADNLRVFNLTCPPTPTSVCAVAFVNPFVSGGLAVDDLNGVVFYSRFNPATGQNQIAYATAANPCAPVALLPVAPCAAPAGAFTGLAVDSVDQVIYATDGQRLVAIDYVVTPAGTVVFTNVNCCPPMAGLDPLTGLAVRPGRATPTGAPCNAGTCPACPMVQSTDGDSVLGNANFGLQLNGAPAGSLAWCLIGDGPCMPVGPVVPPLCGQAHTLPLLGILGANFVGGAGCAGQTTFALPLPPNASLGGLVLSSQCFVWCPAGVGGTAMSQCLSFELQGL